MRQLIAVLASCFLPLVAQEPTGLACILRIGPISYPALSWGAEYSGVVTAVVTVGNLGDARNVRTEDQPNEWGAALDREVRNSIASSLFDSACAGRTVRIDYQFVLEGDKTTTLESAVTKEPPDEVRIAARPPGALCAGSAESDDEAEAFRGQAAALLDVDFLGTLRCTDASIAWKGNADAYVMKGMALRKLNRLREAVAAYDEAEKLDSRDPNLHFNRANSHRDLGELDDAIRDYTTAIERMTEPRKAYDNRGSLYLRLGRVSYAQQDYSRALELDPADIVARHNLGAIHLILEEPQEALKEYEAAIAINPPDPVSLAGRALSLLSLRRRDEAISGFTDAIRLDATYVEPRYNRGLAYYQAKKYREALADLTETIRLKPDCAEAFFLRSVVRSHLGDAESARSDRQQAVKLGFSEDTDAPILIPRERPR